MFGGAMGGIASTLAENNILTQQKLNKTPIDAARALTQQCGAGRLLRGLPPLMGRELVFGSCMLYFSDQGAKAARDKVANNFFVDILARILIGTAGALLTHPLD